MHNNSIPLFEKNKFEMPHNYNNAMQSTTMKEFESRNNIHPNHRFHDTVSFKV
jgi:hypothetical protein